LDDAVDEGVGGLVSIAPDDYGQVAVQGELVSKTDQGCVIARENSRVGKVHVHFPQQGFVLTPLP
jgi:hypothetical protein